jgi:MoaA/NifB/PqqE/SkfB family radical SAM enzyme
LRKSTILAALAQRYGAELRLTRLRPTGRGREVWEELRPTTAQNRQLYQWLLAHPEVLTGDSFFHLSAYGQPLEGLNLCGAGRIVCCVDPVGEVYACPFLLAPEFSAGNVRQPGGFTGVWRTAPLFAHCATGRWAGVASNATPTPAVTAAASRPSISPADRRMRPIPTAFSNPTVPSPRSHEASP